MLHTFPEHQVYPVQGFNGHPPLGVNATLVVSQQIREPAVVSMGTHPWG